MQTQRHVDLTKQFRTQSNSQLYNTKAEKIGNNLQIIIIINILLSDLAQNLQATLKVQVYYCIFNCKLQLWKMWAVTGGALVSTASQHEGSKLH